MKEKSGRAARSVRGGKLQKEKTQEAKRESRRGGCTEIKNITWKKKKGVLQILKVIFDGAAKRIKRGGCSFALQVDEVGDFHDDQSNSS